MRCVRLSPRLSIRKYKSNRFAVWSYSPSTFGVPGAQSADTNKLFVRTNCPSDQWTAHPLHSQKWNFFICGDLICQEQITQELPLSIKMKMHNISSRRSSVDDVTTEVGRFLLSDQWTIYVFLRLNHLRLVPEIKQIV